jgi:periplasmic protein TonB
MFKEMFKEIFKLTSKKISIIFAPVIVIGLFILMGVLIFQDSSLKKPDSKSINVQFLRNYKERDVETISRQKPEKPKDPVKAPDAPKVNVAKPEKQEILKMQSFAQSFDASALGSGIAAGGYGGGVNDENTSLTPIIAVVPTLPDRARIEGITGQVTAIFDVNELGFVENVRILQSKPARIFDQNVVQALYSSRYRPKKVDGKPIAVRGLMRTYQLGF